MPRRSCLIAAPISIRERTGSIPEHPALRTARMMKADLLTFDSFQDVAKSAHYDRISIEQRLPTDGRGKVNAFVSAVLSLSAKFDSTIVFDDRVGIAVAKKLNSSKEILITTRPEAALKSLDEIGDLAESTTRFKFVVFSATQHIYLSERHSISANNLELIPWPVDHRFFSPKGSDRDDGLVASCQLAHLDAATLTRVLRKSRMRLKVIRRGKRKLSIPGAEWVEDTPQNRRDLFRNAGSLLLPLTQRYNASGIDIIAEAMACGLPVVMSRIMGLEHVVRDDAEGKITEIGDADAMADALNTYRSDPDFFERTSANCRRKAEEMFAMGSFASRISIINKALGKQNDKPEFFIIPAQSFLSGKDA